VGTLVGRLAARMAVVLVLRRAAKRSQQLVAVPPVFRRHRTNQSDFFFFGFGLLAPVPLQISHFTRVLNPPFLPVP